jgi:DNA-binding transcriptional LysR family regulator
VSNDVHRGTVIGAGVDLDLRLLRYFVSVVERGSVSTAARELVLTQPALSRAVRALERQLGVDLLVRSPRGVEPTAAGLTIYEHAHALRAAARSAVTAARASIDPMVEHDSLCLSAAGEDAVIAVSAARALRADGVRLRTARVDGVGQQVEFLGRSTTDIALVREPFGGAGLRVTRIATEPRVALLASAHPMASAGTLELVDLHGEPVTVPSWLNEQQRWHWAGVDGRDAEADGGQGPPWVRGPEVDDLSDVLSAVGAGAAIAFLPLSTVRTLARVPGVSVVEVHGLSPSALDLAWLPNPARQHTERVVRALVPALRASAARVWSAQTAIGQVGWPRRATHRRPEMASSEV